MISKIYIENLFGRFNYDITTKQGGITIITGPNGFGKSTILQIINKLSKADIEYFFKLEFSLLVVEFEDKRQIRIEKTEDGIKIDDINVNVKEIAYIKSDISISQMEEMKDSDIYVSKTDFSSFVQKSMLHNIYFNVETKLKNIMKKLDQIKKLCGDVRFITDQRLLQAKITRTDEPRVIDVIRELPKRLKAQISKVSEEYSRVANNLDSTYPKRLFAAKDGIENQSEYEAYLKDANEKFKKLSNYNLVQLSFIDEKDYNQKYSTALKIYFDDFAKKYKVFQDLIAKLDLFTKIINNRLTFKQIRITRDEGFQVVDEDNPQKVLQLSQLSSGEKQEIVLFYELIFDTKKGLLLLIDEPEISLHIAWQKQFLDDLVKVSKQTAVQVIVATHSPQIISKYLDIQVDLGELYENKLYT